MEVVRGLLSPLPRLHSPVATIGAFDGVHRGHQRILAAAVSWARELDGHAAVVTFDPLPKSVLGHGEALCITSLPHRLALLERCGPRLAAVLAFDDHLAMLSAEDFVRQILVEWLGVRRVVLGRDATFGRSAQGNLPYLRTLEAQGLLEVRSPAPVLHRGKVISSTAIRQAIARGSLREAAAMLGRPFSLLGTVVHGSARGHSLGFPTANLDLHHEAIPPNGVYAATTSIGERRYPALTYIGTRPTFEPEAQASVVEVHVVGLDADLYGRDIEVEFLKKLRGDVHFPSPAALVAQMNADRAAALAACSERARRAN